jgi:hypothetical protein
MSKPISKICPPIGIRTFQTLPHTSGTSTTPPQDNPVKNHKTARHGHRKTVRCGHYKTIRPPQDSPAWAPQDSTAAARQSGTGTTRQSSGAGTSIHSQRIELSGQISIVRPLITANPAGMHLRGFSKAPGGQRRLAMPSGWPPPAHRSRSSLLWRVAADEPFYIDTHICMLHIRTNFFR